MEQSQPPFTPPLTFEQRRARRRLGALLCRFLALACLVGSWFVIERVTPDVTEGLASLGWTRTEGVVLNAGRGWNRILHDDGQSHEAWLRLSYAYEAPTASGDPRHLTGIRYDVSTHTTAGSHEYSMTTVGMARHCLADAPAIPVYYDPTDPERSVVSPGIPYGTGSWLILLTTLFVAALWLLRGAREIVRAKLPAVVRDTADTDSDGEPEGPPPGGQYVEDADGEYWRPDDPEAESEAAGGEDEQDEAAAEFEQDELDDVVPATPPSPAKKAEATALGAVLACTLVPAGGLALMASLAYLWEKAIGGVPPVEIVLVYCGLALLLAVAPRFVGTAIGGTSVASIGCGVPLLAAVALGILFYEDMTDNLVERISYERDEAVLLDEMRSAHPAVREVAVRAAGHRKDLESVKPLIVELLDDPDEDVRDAAWHAAHRRHLPLPRKK